MEQNSIISSACDNEKSQVKHTRGYGLRIVFAVFLLYCAIALLPTSIFMMTSEVFWGLIMLIIGVTCTVSAILQFISASKGRQSKGWNNVSIVLGSIFFGTIFGILGIVGGVRGKKVIDNPELDKEHVSDGRKLRIIFAILLLIITILFITLGMVLTPPWYSIDDYIEDVYYDFYYYDDYNDYYDIYYYWFYEEYGYYDESYDGYDDFYNKYCKYYNDEHNNYDIYYEENYERLLKYYQDDMLADWILISLGILCAVLSTLEFVSAVKGKNHKGWNVYSIVTGSIFSVAIIGLFGIVGGVQGNKMLPKKPRKVKEKRVKTNGTQELDSQLLNEGVVAIEEKTPEEYIQPKMSLKGKKAIMWTIVASYSLFLIVGILLTAIPAMAKIISGLGICEEVNARAYGIAIGSMWIALVPTIGYFFATISPYELSKKKKIILSSTITALLVITNTVFLVIINTVKLDGLAIKQYFEGSDSWFIPLSMIFGSVASMICYALTLFKLNPQKIKTKKPTMPEGNKIIGIIVHVFKLIGYGVLCLTKKILTFKEKQPDVFILIATILLTWLSFFTSFIFAIVCIAIMTAVALMYFFGVISLLSIDTKSQPIVKADDVLPTAKEYTYTDSRGYIQTIYSEDKKDFYDAGGHYIASSHDDGKTVQFVSADVRDEENQDEE